ncbi:uncharacterized protein LOC107371909 [Tetranychus urticae]|uniref:uncharacterized protein LOC107371909 n=1 Tax=Tetranychus urticae TaxID=32264 RepID=UPI00077BBB6F|nr:uncharacterized protein LOC107371909 [Tetranychus urticae]
MEYLHQSSFPATKSELEIFSVPPTQTAISHSYQVEYRPTSSIEKGDSFEILVPASDDFTDLQATMIDLIVGTVNTSQASNRYHYQSWFEDTLFRVKNKIDSGRMDESDSTRIANGIFDLYFRMHLPLCEQDKLLINAVPISFRFNKSPEGFPLIKTDATDTESYQVQLNAITLHIRRVKLFPDAQISILKGLIKSPAKYFITRNEIRVFSISSNLVGATIESLFSGILPRRVVIGFVDDAAHIGSLTKDPYQFQHFNINYIALQADGNLIPSLPYQPNFEKKLYMREFVNLYRALGQDEGQPQLDVSYEDFGKSKTLFAFDLTPDGSIGAENGTLSLLKRGNIRLHVKFSKTLTTSIKAIIFAQFDNVITIDQNRNVTVDY